MNSIVRMMKRYIKTPLKYALPLLFISALVLSATTGCTSNTSNSGSGQPAQGTMGVSTPYKSSDGATAFNVTVFSAKSASSVVWTGSSGYSYTETPKPGNTFIVVDTGFRNSGSNKVYVSPSDFSMQDSTGAKYDQSFTSVNNELKTTDLYSGQNTRGVVFFEIPKSATGLKLMYDSNTFSSGSSGVTVWNVS